LPVAHHVQLCGEAASIEGDVASRVGKV
jgi:hypothetical protein